MTTNKTNCIDTTVSSSLGCSKATTCWVAFRSFWTRRKTKCTNNADVVSDDPIQQGFLMRKVPSSNLKPIQEEKVEGTSTQYCPSTSKPPRRGGCKYASPTASCPPRGQYETYWSYLKRRTYGEMQRPGVGSNRKVYSPDIATRPSQSNKRRRSKYFRSR